MCYGGGGSTGTRIYSYRMFVMDYFILLSSLSVSTIVYILSYTTSS